MLHSSCRLDAVELFRTHFFSEYKLCKWRKWPPQLVRRVNSHKKSDQIGNGTGMLCQEQWMCGVGKSLVQDNNNTALNHHLFLLIVFASQVKLFHKAPHFHRRHLTDENKRGDNKNDLYWLKKKLGLVAKRKNKKQLSWKQSKKQHMKENANVAYIISPFKKGSYVTASETDRMSLKGDCSTCLSREQASLVWGGQVVQLEF